MKVFNKFVESKKEPSNKNDIWFDGNTWNMYKEGEWRPFTVPIEAAEKIKENLDSLKLFNIVEYLPDVGKDNIIYLLNNKNGSESNSLIEYIYINNKWEEIGSFTPSFDLDGYVKSEDLEKALTDYVKKTDLAKINGKPIYEGGNIEITGGGTSSGKYQSNIEDGSIAMTEDYGDFKVGTTVEALNGKTYNDLFDGILFPTIEPTHDNPSVTGFTLTSSTSPVKIGTNVVQISAATLYRGKWTTYNDNLPYTGDATAIEYTCLINNITYTDINKLPEKYTQLGNQTYKAKISYKAGPAPKNNKGKEVPALAAPAGSVTSGTRTINVTLPWYASTANANDDNPVVEQKLIAWNDKAGQMATGEFALQPSGTLTQVFKIPRKLSSIEVFDTGSDKWVTENKNDYTESTENISIGGNTYSYYVYEYKGESRGETKLNVKF